MPGYYRRTTPKVSDGRVQKKNRHALTPNYWNTYQKVPVIDKERPGRNYRHLLNKKDILEFIEIVPEWNELSKGLDAVLLAPGEQDTDGWYDNGVVGICAWERNIWREVSKGYFREHAEIFSRLGVESKRRGNVYLCHFTEVTAKAYQLLHIFLHELGHHHDRMTTKNQKYTGRGETYAEEWAIKYEQIVWDSYLKKFDLA
jgi:hypothetical protein